MVEDQDSLIPKPIQNLVYCNCSEIFVQIINKAINMAVMADDSGLKVSVWISLLRKDLGMQRSTEYIQNEARVVDN